jgi:hypothetical protein
MGHTAMVAKQIVLVFLLACHTSSPSVPSGSGAAETPPPAAVEAPAQPPQPQIAAPDPTPVAPAPTPAPESRPAPTTDPSPAPIRPAKVPPTKLPPPPTADPTGTAPGISEKCGDGDACANGLTCVSYYGFAGMRGPQFKTCEARCTSDKVCPGGRHCVTVSDGPGQVCR